MRRDYFTLSTRGGTADASEQPVIRVTYGGPISELESRLDPMDRSLDDDGIDVTYRLRESAGADAMGVFAVTDRVTGEYILELDVEAGEIFAVTAAASDGSERDGNGRYRLVIESDDGTPMATYERSTLLVYGVDGGILRDRSLIPSGVEI
ncbi:MAG: DUF5793 family protein [Halobacteriota archaeon]|uniref:DUF5793 family protein n=1 Tax=Natronomonas sp. TaxID=2184060 RepID=UPI00397540C7